MTKRKRIGMIGICFLLLAALGTGVFWVHHSYRKKVYPHGNLTETAGEIAYSIPEISAQKATTPSVGYSLYIGDTLIMQNENGCISTLSKNDSLILSVYETSSDMKTTIENECMPALTGVETFGATHTMESVIEEDGYSGSFPALYASGNLKMKSNFSKSTDYFVAYYLSTGKEKNLLLMVTCKEASKLQEGKEFLDSVRASIQQLPYESFTMERPDIIEKPDTDGNVLLDSSDRYEFRISDQSEYYDVVFQYSNSDAVIEEAYITNEYAPNYEPEQTAGNELRWRITNPWFTTYTIHVKSDKDLGDTSVEGNSKEGKELTFTLPGKLESALNEDGYEVHEFQITEDSEYFHIVFGYQEKETEIVDAYITGEDGQVYQPEANEERYPYSLYWKIPNPQKASYKVYIKPADSLARSHLYVLSDEAYNEIPERQGAPAN